MKSRITYILSLVTSLLFVTASLTAQDARSSWGSTVLSSTINDNRVNVREYPGTAGAVQTQLNKGQGLSVTGISKDKFEISGESYYWYRVFGQTADTKYFDGWVYGKYLSNVPGYSPSAISVLSITPNTATMAGSLKVQMVRGTKTDTFEVEYSKVPSQNFYTFVWAFDDPRSNYRDVPGTYVWYPDSKKTELKAYTGQRDESGGVEFTDDFKYSLEDLGTGPAPRGMIIRKTSNNEVVFSGNYYQNTETRGHTAVVVFDYADREETLKKLAPDIFAEASTYKQANPKPVSTKEGLTNTLLIFCRLDMDTKKLSRDKIEYVVTQ